MDISEYFENDETCDGHRCPDRETCARWNCRCALAFRSDGEIWLAGFPVHNTRLVTASRKCPFWLSIPNDKYPGKDDESAIPLSEYYDSLCQADR